MTSTSQFTEYRVMAEGMKAKWYKTEKGALNAAQRLHGKEVTSSRMKQSGAYCTRPRMVKVYRTVMADGMGVIEDTMIAKF